MWEFCYFQSRVLRVSCLASHGILANKNTWKFADSLFEKNRKSPNIPELKSFDSVQSGWVECSGSNMRESVSRVKYGML